MGLKYHDLLEEMMANTEAPSVAPILCAAGEGERRWWYGGGVFTWKITAEQSGGAFMMCEDEMEQGKVTPLHTHPLSDETFYLLEGEILVHLDGVEHTVGAGGVMFAPRGLPHAFLVVSPTARMLTMHTPGACQEFFTDASCPLMDGESAGEVDFDKVRESAAKNPGIELLGPPPFATP